VKTNPHLNKNNSKFKILRTKNLFVRNVQFSVKILSKIANFCPTCILTSNAAAQRFLLLKFLLRKQLQSVRYEIVTRLIGLLKGLLSICECLKCPPPAPSSNTSLQSLNFRSLSQLCRWVRLPQITWSASLKFGACFRLWFKLAVSLQHCTPYVIVHWVNILQIWKPLVFVMKSKLLARSQFCTLCAVSCTYVGAPSC